MTMINNMNFKKLIKNNNYYYHNYYNMNKNSKIQTFLKHFFQKPRNTGFKKRFKLKFNLIYADLIINYE